MTKAWNLRDEHEQAEKCYSAFL